MRAYRIELTSKTGVSIGIDKSKQPNFQPPTELTLQQNLGNMGDNVHIEFECVSHCDTSNKSIYDRAVLSLYNVNKYWHNENSIELVKSHFQNVYTFYPQILDK